MTFLDIPLELRQRPQWVIWRREVRKGKTTKVPYQPLRPKANASSTDPSTWAGFEEAVAASEQADGIGFVFSPDDSYVGVDLDEVSATTHPAALLLNSYTEESPSGSGLHVILKGSLAEVDRNRHGKVEVYEQGRYFCMTGKHVPGSPTTIEERQAELDEFVREFLPAKAKTAPTTPSATVELADSDLLDKMLSARNGRRIGKLWQGDWSGYTSHSEADLALCAHLAYWTARDPARMDALFRASGLYREKWEREDYRNRTLDAAIAKTLKVYEPNKTGPTSLPAETESLHAASGEETPTERKVFFTAPELRDYVSPHIDWVIERLLAKSLLTLFGGKPKAGKTTFAFGGLHAMRYGVPFMGLRANPGRVLYVTEQNKTTIRPKLEEYGLLDWDGLTVMFAREMLGEPWEQIVARAASFCEDDHTDLVVVDTVNDLAHLENENDTNLWLNALNPLQALAQHGGVSVWGVCHAKKEATNLIDMFRGSGAVVGKADIVLGLWREGSGEETTRTVEGISRLDNGFDEKTRITRDGCQYVTAGTLKEIEAERRLAEILDALPVSEADAITRQALQDATGMGKSVLAEHMKRLELENRVRWRVGARNSRAYWIERT